MIIWASAGALFLVSQSALGQISHCTIFGNPVCATNPKTHKKETYPNACYAKQAGAAIVYQGKCLVVNLPCKQNYAWVCGSLHGSNTQESFINLCHLQKAGAEFLHGGKCTNP